MHESAKVQHFIDGVPASTLPVSDSNFLYGFGLFETVRIYDGQLVFWHEHLARMEKGITALALPAVDIDVIRRFVSDLSLPDAGVMRLSISAREAAAYSISTESGSRWVLSIFEGLPGDDVALRVNGILAGELNGSLQPQGDFAGIKHCNRLEQVVFASKLARFGWQEGICRDIHGDIVEGVKSNVFFVIGDTVCTPDLSACGIDGVMRAKIFEAAASGQLDVNVVEATLTAIDDADEIFFCNSVKGILPVAKLGERVFEGRPVTERIQQFFAGDFPLN